jgi:hypothetical protein
MVGYAARGNLTNSRRETPMPSNVVGEAGVSLIRVANNEVINDASGQVRVLARAIRVDLARADDANVRVHQSPLRSAPAAVWCNAL